MKIPWFSTRRQLCRNILRAAGILAATLLVLLVITNIQLRQEVKDSEAKNKEVVTTLETLQGEIEELKEANNSKEEPIDPLVATFADLFEVPGTEVEAGAELLGIKGITANYAQIAIDPPVYDLGTVKKSDGKVTAKYTIKNVGRATLTLNYAFTSCGCTAAPIEKETLDPGESTTIDVTYDPNYFGEFYDVGIVEKKVTVISNDPSKPFYTVKLKANVIP